MTRPWLMVGLVCLAAATANAQSTKPTNPSAAPPSYYSAPPKAAPSGPTVGGNQPIRRVAGETPVAPEAPEPRPSNVITQPPAGNNPNAGLPPPATLTRPAQGNFAPPAPVGPMMPPGFPLTPEQEQKVDYVLRNWETTSGQIQRFRCDFQRWEYDPVFGPKDSAKTWSQGKIKFMQPDKGLFEVLETKIAGPVKKEGEKPEFIKQPEENLEKWICNGKSVFEFDAKDKKLRERTLPPEMQGKAIADGPLPFLFGANAAKLKARYWVRPITPANVTNEYWLEALPKSASDAANFKKVHIVLDAADFSPKIMQLFAPNYDEKRNPARAVYEFKKKESNWSELLDKLNPFHTAFFEPKAPSGWTKVVERFDAPPPGSPPGPAGGQAALPTKPLR